MKPTREQVVEWSREAGLAGLSQESDMTYLMRLVDRIFAAGQSSAAQGVESVGTLIDDGFRQVEWVNKPPAGTKLYTAPPTAAAIEAQVKKACAKVCERLIHGDGICADNEVWIHDCAAAIRALPPMFSAPAVNQTSLICPRCKVDRFKDPCPDNSANCPMNGEAYTAAPEVKR